MTTTSSTSRTPAPAALQLNTPNRFYRGGERILAFRGLPVPEDFDGHRPEDWLASTTHLFAEGGGGVTALDDGTTLPAALAADATGLARRSARRPVRRRAAAADQAARQR